MDEPTVLSLLAEQISALERNVNRRFDAQDDELKEIKRQTRETNGRVTMLEKARARTQGAVSAYAWVPVVLSSLLAAGLTILVMALSGGIHVG